MADGKLYVELKMHSPLWITFIHYDSISFCILLPLCSLGNAMLTPLCACHLSSEPTGLKLGSVSTAMKVCGISWHLFFSSAHPPPWPLPLRNFSFSIPTMHFLVGDQSSARLGWGQQRASKQKLVYTEAGSRSPLTLRKCSPEIWKAQVCQGPNSC